MIGNLLLRMLACWRGRSVFKPLKSVYRKMSYRSSPHLIGEFPRCDCWTWGVYLLQVCFRPRQLLPTENKGLIYEPFKNFLFKLLGLQ